MRLFLLLILFLVAPARAEEPLPPDQAFRFSAQVIDAQTLEARWQIADGYYMYREKFKFSLAEGGTLGAAVFPKGEKKLDDIFGEVEVFRKDVRIRLPLTATAGGTLTLKANSQGCWDGGICYPPHDQEASVTLSDSPAAPQNESVEVARLFKSKSLALILASFFGFGLLLSFTPCTFPMIPILSGIIVSHGHAVTHLRAFVLSTAYVLGMALTYAAIGVAAGFSGTLLSAALQNAWVLGGFALVFVVLSLSMFGLYELQLPTALQSRISDSANRQGGSLPAIALMGAISALIVGPCVAAPLAGALLYIAATGDAALGGSALFVMALGMGLPLVLVGTFSRSLLPRSGPWMDGVERFFGVVMLATALWLVTPVIPVWAQMLGWALLLILPAVFLHALDALPPRASGLQKLGKGIGIVLLLGGAAMLVGVLGGARNPLQPLEFLRSGASAAPASAASRFERVATVEQLDTRLANTGGKPVMLDFYADWCVSCKEMEHLTFSDPAVAAAMQRFLLLQADVTANSEADKALLKRFQLFGPPGILFFDAKGKEKAEPRVVGFQNAAQFLAVLNQALEQP
jgi:thiol:disulfide interchange protein DsbD